MSLLHLPIKSITEKDLLRLIDDQIPESKHLEYKRDLCLVTDEQKMKVLSGLSALANTDGGDIVYGMDAKPGYADDLVGLKNFNKDDILCKIENLLRDFLQPRLKGLQHQVVLLENGNHTLILRIPRSFTAPHMVRHKGNTRFCGRNSNGKYDLDVHELRAAFVDNEAMGERLKNFRLDRVNRLIAGDHPRPLYGKHLLVLHVLPLQGASPTYQVDHDAMVSLTKLNRFFEFNFEGIRADFNDCMEKSPGYFQVYRNGFMEIVDARLLHPDYLAPSYRKDGLGAIPNILLEDKILDYFKEMMGALDHLGCSSPYTISLSLLNVSKYEMAVKIDRQSDRSHPIEQNHLLTREVLVESLSEPGKQVLKPLFDQIWNACGYPGSQNYHADGTRKDVS